MVLPEVVTPQLITRSIDSGRIVFILFYCFDPNEPGTIQELLLYQLHFHTSRSKIELALVYGICLTFSIHPGNGIFAEV
jgi:hypothetical protein